MREKRKDRSPPYSQDRSVRFIVLITIWTAAVTYSSANEATPTATDLHAEGNSSMSEETMLRDLFDRWERVWHEGQYDLIPDCVQPNYIRHDEAGDRTVTREVYAAEIAKTRQAWRGERTEPRRRRFHFSIGSAANQSLQAGEPGTG